MCEVRIEVEGEAVIGDPFFYRDTNGADFAGFNPDPGFAFAAGGFEAVVHEGLNKDRFEIAEVGVEVAAVREGKDWVAYDLPRTVVGDVAPSVGGEELDAAGIAFLRVPEQVLLGVFAQPGGKDRFMLGKDKSIRDAVGATCLEAFLLAFKGGRVGGAPPIEDLDHSGRLFLGEDDAAANHIAGSGRGLGLVLEEGGQGCWGRSGRLTRGTP